jgi:hypothetical protein
MGDGDEIKATLDGVAQFGRGGISPDEGVK